MRSESVVRGRLRRVLLPLGVLMAMFVAAVPGAQALEEHHYGGVLIQPGQKVQAPSSGWNGMSGNIAGYEGSGEVSVCESVYHWNGTWQKSCGIKAAGNALNQMAWWGESMTAYVENNSGTAHTIQGWWYGFYDELGNLFGRPGGVLTENTRIESANMQYSFRMQSDGNAVVYNNNTMAACWSTQTNGHPGSYARMQEDGNFVVYGAGVPEGGTPYWFTTHTNGNRGAAMKMQNDGNLVIYGFMPNGKWEAIWATSWITGRLGC